MIIRLLGPLEVIFWEIELGLEDALCSQCRSRGSYWWVPKMWELGLRDYAENCKPYLGRVLYPIGCRIEGEWCSLWVGL